MGLKTPVTSLRNTGLLLLILRYEQHGLWQEVGFSYEWHSAALKNLSGVKNVVWGRLGDSVD